MDEDKRQTTLLDHGWRHFAFHAQQRLNLVNFFVVLTGLVIASWVQVTTREHPMFEMGIPLGLFLCFLSFLFWRMDQRNVTFIKSSERVMFGAEEKLFDGANLFDAADSDKLLRRGWSFWFAKQWSHGQSLRFLFATVGLTGLLGAMYSIYRLIR